MRSTFWKQRNSTGKIKDSGKAPGRYGLPLRLVSGLLVFSLAFSPLPWDDLLPRGASRYLGVLEAQAVNRGTLSLDLCRKLAVANSEKMETLELKLMEKEAALKSATKSVAMKRHNLRTFRWSPLLKFKFPQKLSLANEYEFEFKPLNCQVEIDKVKHAMTDQVLAEYETVNNLYTDIYLGERTIEFTENRLDEANATLTKNNARLNTGEATPADLKTMQAKVDSLNKKLNVDKATLVQNKKLLSKAIGMDVTTGYTFENPFLDSSITRDQLDKLIQYTLDRDDNYYDVSMNTQVALLTLQSNFRLMSNEYGWKIGFISPYIYQAMRGQTPRPKAFKLAYDKFVKAIDAPWDGYYKIKLLFFTIKFKKELTKGDMDGSRYIEDDPYVLQSNCADYLAQLKEKESVRSDLIKSVTAQFNNYIKIKSTLNDYRDMVARAEKEVSDAKGRNLAGELTYKEYADIQDNYELTQQEMLDTLALYTKALNDLDRLTCGGVSAYLSGNDIDMGVVAGGISVPDDEYAQGAYYYVEPIISEMQFRLSVNIPDDFEVDVTDFELWCNDIKIGDTTSLSDDLRHLTLSTKDTDVVKLRFYNSGAFVDDVVIDPEVYSGPINILKGYTSSDENAPRVGSYVLENNTTTGTIRIDMNPDPSENIKGYIVKTGDGEVLGTGEVVDIGTPFRHLSVIQEALDSLEIEFYGEGGGLLYKGFFNTGNLGLYKLPGN